MKPLRFAMIGVGFWAKFQIAAWLEVKGAQLVALCDLDRAKAEAAATNFGVPRIYTDAEELLRCERLDFVDIAANPQAHAPLVELAARFRIPVICQKPMALDLATCERMVATCQAASVPFLMHENYRWQTPMRRLKQLLNEGQIGLPFRAQLQFSHATIELYQSQPYLFTDPHFALHDMGPHFLDLPRFFFGEPRSLYAREFNVHPKFKGEDIVSVMLGYDAARRSRKEKVGRASSRAETGVREHSRAASAARQESRPTSKSRHLATISGDTDTLTCHCELSWRTTPYQVFIEGTTGTLLWETNGILTIENDSGRTTERIAPKHYTWADARYGFAHSSIVATNTHLLAALRGEIVPETTGEDNRRTMRLVFAAQDSAARNEVVRL